MKISDIGERELVRHIKSLCANKGGADLIEGIGDDCAVYLPSRSSLQVVTIDALVEKTHFSFDYFPPLFLGRKAISVNVSDVAAMGAVPLYALVSLQLPKDFRMADIDNLYKGMMEVASAYSLSIIGGNLTSSQFFAIHIVMIGEVGQDKVVSRSGAKEGDSIYITGNIGDASAGFEIVSSKRQGVEYQSLRDAYLDPIPMANEGRLLADNDIPSAMIDVSDGIASDLRQIAVSSGVGAIIKESTLPTSKDLRKYTSEAGRDILDYQLYGGEDYQLLFTVSAEREDSLLKLIEAGDIRAGKIGCIREGKDILLVGKGGKERDLGDRGFSHF